VRRRRHHLLICALALACLALPSSADAYVFWTTRDGGYAEADKVGRANLDGSEINRALLGVALAGVAAGADHIYFTSLTQGGGGEGGGNPVDARTNLDGGERIERLTVGNEGGIQAVDAEHVYWLGPTGLGRAKLDLSDPEPGYLTGLDGIGLRFTVYEGFVYWPVEELGVGCSIGRANLATKVVEPEWIPECSGPEIEGPIGIAVDSYGVFWSYLSADGQIGHANLLGGAVESDFIGGTKAFGGPIAIEGPDLYWASDAGIGHAHLENGGSASVIDNDFIGGFEGEISALAVNSASGPSAPAPPSPPAPTPAPAPPPPPSPTPVAAPLKSLPVPKLKFDTKAGTATLTLVVPGPGAVVVSGTGIKRLHKVAKAAGPVALLVRPTKATAGKLKRDSKAKVTAKIVFTPTGGAPLTESKTLTLKRTG
jgi:hypothetical protein